MDIDTLIFERIKFGQTSSGEFAYLAPNYDKPEVQGIYTIYSETDLNNDYKFLRAGFKNQYLDWVELEFAVPQSYNKIIETYGKPSSITLAALERRFKEELGVNHVNDDIKANAE